MIHRCVTCLCALSLSIATARSSLAQTHVAENTDGTLTGDSAGDAPAPSQTAAPALEQSPQPLEAAPESPELSAKPDETSLVVAAEAALAEVDFASALRLAKQALEEGKLDLNETRRAYRVYAIAAAQLERTEEATTAFKRLFALDPSNNLERRLSPMRRNPALDARGFWSLHKGESRAEVLFDRQLGQVVVRTHDALGWFKQVDVVSRVDGGSYRRRGSAVAPELEFEEAVSPTSTVEVYVEVFDEHGNLLQRVGDERMPLRFAPSSAELADSTRDIRGGQVGSYGRRLDELGVDARVHGFVTAELRPENDTVTFDLHHASVWFRAELLKRASLEFGLEVEHLFLEVADLYIPHAFIDLTFHELATARVGLFEAPVGAFNEYLYPDFLRTTGLPPLYSREVVPALWSEVGVQLRGRLALQKSVFLTYAAFVSNGLEQRDDTPGDGQVAEGGSLRDMRFNTRDQNNSSKAFGGRIGYEAGSLDLGISGYRGRYTVDAVRHLNILDADASFRLGDFTARAEGAIALQEVTGRTIKKMGGYLLSAYRVIPYIEPYVQYDHLTMESSQNRVLLGTAIYPFPMAQGARRLRLKVEAGPTWLGNFNALDWTWFTQLTTGF